jgi:hypothetical protein
VAEPKTKSSNASVKAFLATVDDPKKRADCEEVARMMRAATGSPAKMWGTSIVGFGTYEYTYESGHSGTWMLCGFAPRKQNLVIYIMSGFARYPALMKEIGKHKTGKSCLYIKKLDDIDRKVLAELIRESVNFMRDKYKPGKISAKPRSK